MSHDLVWTITANAIFLAISIANAWIIARYNKSQRRKGKARVGEPWFEKMYRRVDLLSAIVVLGSVAALVFLMSFPLANANLQTLQIAIFVGQAVLAIMFYFVWQLSLRIDRHAERLSDVVDLMKDATGAIGGLTDMVSTIVRPELKESPNRTVDADARESGARGSP